uniref:ATP synthase subunit 6 n=1 Tax=Hydatigera krepkogorski TaxID=1434709 RepID=N0DQZ2_9CEST|nr:ATP synthase F0 subunit 6 [Hydatigera krepkogorski]BAN15682.1 ATP synthase subunit 6 [Hydatigera krepkogorski]
MFNLINDFSSLISVIYSKIINGSIVYYYLSIILWTMLLFLTYRFPYCYSPLIFVIYLVGVVFVCFVSLWLNRLFNNVDSFFASFVPVGTPIFICPLVCIAELISYVIRPFVLILRPFINISLGCFGAVYVGGIVYVNYWCFILLVILFFYEVFIALVHWFIVLSILLFSSDH